MNNIEDIYNQAVQLLKQGHSKQEVLLKFAEQKNELAPLLDLSDSLFAMPKNIVPTPLMQRRYQLAPSKSFWLTWIHVSKFAGVSMSIVLLLSAFAATGYGVSKSAPGESLFALKKAGEKIELILTPNQTDKANLQVAIAQQRFSQAQAILNDPQSNPNEKTAALSELADQTSNAIAEVKSVTSSNPKSQASAPLVNTLDNLAKQQENLLAQIKPDSQVKTDAADALQTLALNTDKLSELKQSLAISNNNQSLVKLNANQDAVTILGEIDQASSTAVTIQKTTFNINPQTVIKDAQGKTTDAKSLTAGTQVNIVGVKSKESLIAQQIFITQLPQATSSIPEVKGVDTGTVSTTDNKGSSTPMSGVKKITKDSFGSEQQASNTPSSNSDTARGAFIIEDPNPMYVK